MRRLWWLTMALGCSEPVTEIQLIISQVGINIPRDIDTLRINAGPDKFNPDVLLGRPIYLCDAFPTISECKHLPLTATLIPGNGMPDHNVRLEVQAKLHGDTDTSVVRVRDVVNFKFTPHRSLRLELVLTPNCLDDPLRCADAESACYQFGCYNPTPTEPGADMTVVLDLSTPRDLAGADFKNVDLACKPDCPAGYCGIDKNNCGVACTCDSNSFTTCGAGMMCVPCGADNQTCCPTAPRCQSSTFACDSPDPNGKCVLCVAEGGSCSGGGQPCCAGTVCDGSTCVRCGKMAGDRCCSGATCDGGLACNGTTCQPCGTGGQICCHAPAPPCQPSHQCVNGGGGSDFCAHCGDPNEACCQGSCNNMPAVGCDNNGTCSNCGGVVGAACCSGSCFPGLQCVSGHCSSCGQVQGAACCPNNSCGGGLICYQGNCYPPDMAQNTGDMSLAGNCGNHNQPCCPGPACNSDWLVCMGSCVCGSMAQPCCEDGLPCNPGLACSSPSKPRFCTPGDMATIAPSCPPFTVIYGEPCCNHVCPPTFTCCPVPSCAGAAGSVSMDQCFM